MKTAESFYNQWVSWIKSAAEFKENRKHNPGNESLLFQEKNSLWNFFGRPFKYVSLGSLELSEFSSVDRKLALGRYRTPPGISATSFWLWCWLAASGENPWLFSAEEWQDLAATVAFTKRREWLVLGVSEGGGERQLKAKSLTSWPIQKSIALFNLFLIGILCCGFPGHKARPFNHFFSKDPC